MPKWFTCATEPFKGDESFFWRDSGLLSTGLRKLGYESQAVLPGPAPSEDLPGILRADPGQMRDATWWRGLNLDGLILVGWGRHRDTPIVKAIAESGTKLVLHMDAMGDEFPLFSRWEGLKMFWRAEHDTSTGFFPRLLRASRQAATEGSKRLLKHSYLKYRHLRYATVVTCQTPGSAEGHLKLCRLFGGRNHGVNVRLAGYPISDECRYDPQISKKKKIIAIGRWDDLRQKRPGVLMAVSEEIARRIPDLEIDIFGTTTAAMERWHSMLGEDLKARVQVQGRQPGPVVARAMQEAQIAFFPSSFEGGPQALFEALSCGATVVALDSPFLPGPRWAADQRHADLVTKDTTGSFVTALERGVVDWARGVHFARKISEFWCGRTRVDCVLRAMIAVVG